MEVRGCKMPCRKIGLLVSFVLLFLRGSFFPGVFFIGGGGWIMV